MYRAQVGESNTQGDGNLRFRRQLGASVSHIRRQLLEWMIVNCFQCFVLLKIQIARKEHIIDASAHPLAKGLVGVNADFFPIMLSQIGKTIDQNKIGVLFERINIS